MSEEDAMRSTGNWDEKQSDNKMLVLMPCSKEENLNRVRKEAQDAPVGREGWHCGRGRQV